MPEQPGPFLLQPKASVNYDVVPYDFTGFVFSEHSALDGALFDIDLLMPDLEAFAADDSEPTPGVDLIAASLWALIFASAGTGIDFGALDFAAADVETALTLAVNATPSQAFTDPAAPFVPDLNLPVLPPVTIPAGYYTPGSGSGAGSGSTGGPTLPPSSTLSITLTNTDKYGAANFAVGDHFLLTATGPAGAAVRLTATLGGNSLGGQTVGSIDANGQFTLMGQFTADQVGPWVENWYIGDQFVKTLIFLVVPTTTA